MHIVYMRERYFFSLVYAFKKAISFFKLEVDAQKGPCLDEN